MSFMDNLAANPSGGSIYGMPEPKENDPSDVLYLVNKLRDRDMQDFKDKANFMSDMSLRQEQRMRQLYDPSKTAFATNTNNKPAAIVQDPTSMNPYQKGELGIRQQEVDTDKAKLAQQKTFGQEALDIKGNQEKLNQQKSDQINTLKEADLNRKIEEANKKIELAQQALTTKNTNFEQTLAAHKAMAEAVEERHKLEMAQKDSQFKTTADMHQQQIDAMQRKLDEAAHTQTTTEVDPSGNKKTVDTKRGSDAINAPVQNSDGRYEVTAPDGTKGSIPADKLAEWMKKYHPGGGGE